MSTTFFRHLFAVHCLQTLTVAGIFLFFLSPQSAFAQLGKGNYNFLDYNGRNVYFGITIGYNQSDYKVVKSKNFLPSVNDSIAGLAGVQGPGFNLAVVTNLRIGDYFDLRFLPGFSFSERNISYQSTKTNQLLPVQKIEPVFVELPFHIRYKSAPYHDKRLFVTSGIKYDFDITSKSRQRTVLNGLHIAPSDFQFELGAGVQMFFPYFIFSPEIKFSTGLGNILIYQNGLQESSVIEKLISRTVTISLHFEG